MSSADRTAVTNALGQTSSRTYDGLGHLIKITDAAGNITQAA